MNFREDQWRLIYTEVRRYQIERCGHELGVHLAISLHAVTDGLRNILVPLNKKYNLELLIDACRKYPANKHHRITFEYVMLDGINDSIEDAKALLQIVKDVPCKFNLIPFNPFPNSRYKCSSYEQIRRFKEVLMNQDYIVTVRKTRGDDIDAACGQLAGQVKDKTTRSLKRINLIQ